MYRILEHAFPPWERVARKFHPCDSLVSDDIYDTVWGLSSLSELVRDNWALHAQNIEAFASIKEVELSMKNGEEATWKAGCEAAEHRHALAVVGGVRISRLRAKSPMKILMMHAVEL